MTTPLITLYMPVLKTSVKNGQVRWHATISTADIDSFNERLDTTIYDELVTNFQAWQTDAQTPLNTALKARGWTGPIVEPAHISLVVEKSNREKVRIGSIDKLYRDGTRLKAAGTFDDTPLGWAAYRKSVLGAGDAAEEEIRTSICFFPDPNLIIYEDGVKVYKGGSGLAYMDHVALTTVPVNQATDFEAVSKSKTVETMADDVVAVLGEDAAAEVLALTKSRRGVLRSSAPAESAAVVKSEGDTTMDPITNTEQVEQPVAAPTPAPQTAPVVEPTTQLEPAPVAAPVAPLAPVQSAAQAIADVLSQLDQRAQALFNPVQQTLQQMAPMVNPVAAPAVPLSLSQTAPVAQPTPVVPETFTLSRADLEAVVTRARTVGQQEGVFAALQYVVANQSAPAVRRSVAPGLVPASAIVTQQQAGQPVAKSAPETMMDVVNLLKQQQNQPTMPGNNLG